MFFCRKINGEQHQPYHFCNMKEIARNGIASQVADIPPWAGPNIIHLPRLGVHGLLFTRGLLTGTDAVQSQSTRIHKAKPAFFKAWILHGSDHSSRN